jgi:hypothetical protein
MGSFERKISTPPAPAPSLDERLAILESEANRLRAELAELQDDIRWLAGEDEEDGDPTSHSRGLFTRGWVRASLLLAVAGLVGLVSMPYLLHVLDPSSGRTADPIPAPSTQSVAPIAPRSQPERPVAPREYIPAPAVVRSPEAPEPTPAVAAEEHPRSLTRRRERRSPAPNAAPDPSPAPPVRTESP